MSKARKLHDLNVKVTSVRQAVAGYTGSPCKASDWKKRKNILYADYQASNNIHNIIPPIMSGA